MPLLLPHVAGSFLLDVVRVLTHSRDDQAVELLLLRQQLRLHERRARQPRPSRWEQVPLAAIAARLPLCRLLNASACFRPGGTVTRHGDSRGGGRPGSGRRPLAPRCPDRLEHPCVLAAAVDQGFRVLANLIPSHEKDFGRTGVGVDTAHPGSMMRAAR